MSDKANKKNEPVYPVYRVTSFGTDVHFTPDFKSAEEAFKESASQVKFWSVESDGSAKLIRQK